MRQKVNYFNILTVLILITAAAGCSLREEKTRSGGNPDDWAMLPFVKADHANPVLEAGLNEFICPVLKQSVRWEEKDVFNPAAIVRNDSVFLLFRAEDSIGKHAGTSRIGIAASADGLHFQKRKEPVLFPENDSLKVYEWEGGVEDPRVVETEDGNYLMTYTSYDGTTARLMLATSSDLIRWAKHGPVLQGDFKNTWSKSGAIVCTNRNGRIIAARVNGKYWMYFGDTDLFAANSDDLIHWTPVTKDGKLKSVLSPRQGMFDSRLVESGPFALLRDDGIFLIYNGMNLKEGGDKNLTAGAYCGGQVLFDRNDPTAPVKRLEEPFICPDKEYEIKGQVNQVCFLEGMVYFRDHWYLYYGTADSRIAVAIH